MRLTVDQINYRKKIRKTADNVNWNNYIYDSNKKRRYHMRCNKCGKDRGYQRIQYRHIQCQACAKIGKIGNRKGKKSTPQQRHNISKANYKWRKNQDPNYRPLNATDQRIIHNIRCRLWMAIKDAPMALSKSIGCSTYNLRIYLESKFQPGMSWDNYGDKKGIRCWEIDHIKPLSKFDLSKKDELKKACHYTNLQPLWKSENRKKGNKYEH